MATKKRPPVTPGIAGISDDELELLLRLLQETTFVEWRAKMLAGQVQKRVDVELKARG